MSNEDFDFRKQFQIIKSRKNVLIYLLIASFAFITIYNILAQRMYMAEATILPIESSRSNVFSSLGNSSGSGVFQALSGLMGNISSSSKDKLVNILKSRTLTENVINSLKLMPLIFSKQWDEKKGNWKNPDKPPYMEDAVKIMKKNFLLIRNTKEGLITITAIFNDPELTSRIANQLVEELQNFLNLNSVSYGKKNRIFLEGQLEKTRTELADAENNLKEFQETHKILNIDAQAEMTIRTVANLKAEILSREYQLGVMKETIGLETSDARRIMDEKRELEKQLNKLETGVDLSHGKSKSSKISSVQEFPSIEIEYLRLKRKFLILEKVFELLTTQYEIAKIEEVRDQVAFQVVDKASVPMRKYKPQIMTNTLVAILGTFLISILAISILESIGRNKPRIK